jgi:hypothetical protein
MDELLLARKLGPIECDEAASVKFAALEEAVPNLTARQFTNDMKNGAARHRFLSPFSEPGFTGQGSYQLIA